MKKTVSGLLVSLLCIVTGCRSVNPAAYPTAKEWLDQHPSSAGNGTSVAETKRPPPVPWHSVCMEVYDLPTPHWNQKISPLWWFENSADPVPPDWYRPGKKARTFTWYLRNPFHNFDYYVIGAADHKTVRSGKYPEHNMNPQGGWNLAVTAYKGWRLPFASYEGRHIRFYLGWRECGDFGMKFNLKTKKPAVGALAQSNTGKPDLKNP